LAAQLERIVDRNEANFGKGSCREGRRGCDRGDVWALVDGLSLSWREHTARGERQSAYDNANNYGKEPRWNGFGEAGEVVEDVGDRQFDGMCHGC
jgi:hypothetical protein